MEEEEYLILEISNDLIFNKIVAKGHENSITIKNNFDEIEIGNFKFKGEFVETIGTEIILKDSEPIGLTDKILLLNPIISENKM